MFESSQVTRAPFHVEKPSAQTKRGRALAGPNSHVLQYNIDESHVVIQNGKYFNFPYIVVNGSFLDVIDDIWVFQLNSMRPHCSNYISFNNLNVLAV